MDAREIESAFTAYADAILNNTVKPGKILPYFFKETSGEYVVIEQYLGLFNVHYARIKDTKQGQ